MSAGQRSPQARRGGPSHSHWVDHTKGTGVEGSGVSRCLSCWICAMCPAPRLTRRQRLRCRRGMRLKRQPRISQKAGLFFSFFLVSRFALAGLFIICLVADGSFGFARVGNRCCGDRAGGGCRYRWCCGFCRRGRSRRCGRRCRGGRRSGHRAGGKGGDGEAADDQRSDEFVHIKSFRSVDTPRLGSASTTARC